MVRKLSQIFTVVNSIFTGINILARVCHAVAPFWGVSIVMESYRQKYD